MGLRASFGTTVERVESTGVAGMACLLGSATLRNTLCRTSAGRGIYSFYSAGVGLPSLLVKLFNVTAVGSVAGIEASAGEQAAVNIYAKNTIASASTDVVSHSSNPGASTAD
ncbi:MAG: hypothetical protein ACRDPE_05835 [Solirubrobacterales bacterium]